MDSLNMKYYIHGLDVATTSIANTINELGKSAQSGSISKDRAPSVSCCVRIDVFELVVPGRVVAFLELQ